jgi:hypothetical protein
MIDNCGGAFFFFFFYFFLVKSIFVGAEVKFYWCLQDINIFKNLFRLPCAYPPFIEKTYFQKLKKF